MVVQENFDFEDRTLCRTFSDTEGKCVHKLGTDEIYEEAVDVYPCPYEYEEVDEPIETEMEE